MQMNRSQMVASRLQIHDTTDMIRLLSLLTFSLLACVYAQDGDVPDYADLLESFDQQPRKPAATVAIQVAIDLAFVEIEQPANGKPLDGDALLAAFNAGKSQAIQTYHLVTKSGIVARITEGREVSYPTAFDVIASSTNDVKGSIRFGVEPQAFETRHVGTTFEAIPVISPDQQSIDLQVQLSVTKQSPDVDYGFEYPDETGKSVHVPLPQPSFSVQEMTSALVVPAGTTALLGGLQNSEGKGVLGVFITAHLRDANGKTIEPGK